MELSPWIKETTKKNKETVAQNAKKETSVNEDENKSNSAQDNAVAKTKDAEYLNTLENRTMKIGNTIFLVKNRLLILKEALLAGKIIGFGKNCRYPYMWRKEPLFTYTREIVPFESGSMGVAREVETEQAAFNIYVTENMLNHILTHTNEQINISDYYFSTKSSCKYPMTLAELKVFIGMLFVFAVKNDNKMTTTLLWGTCGSDVYNTVMSRNRFEYLVKSLQCDEYSIISARMSTDSFAEIREIWEEFMKISSEVYRPSTNCTIDEMYIAFNGTCRFKWPMQRQPTKYGIKLILMCDSYHRYILSGIPQLDRNKNGSTKLSEFIVKKLTISIYGTNINITYGNDWFTSVALSRKMLRYYKLTTAGTVHQNLPEIPTDMTLKCNRPLGSSIFIYNFEDKLQLYLHYPKKGDEKLVISNIHFDSVMNTSDGKTQALQYYEATRNGVDAITKMSHTSSCSRHTTNWFLTIFLAILDFAGINSHTIFNLKRSKGKPPVPRTDFLHKFALDLMLPFMKERLFDPNTSEPIKNKIISIIKERQNVATVFTLNNTERQSIASTKTIPSTQSEQSAQTVEVYPNDRSTPTTSTNMQEPSSSDVRAYPVISIQRNVWENIRAMYPPAPVRKKISPNKSGPVQEIHHNFDYSVLQTIFSSIYPGTIYFNFGCYQQNCYMPQNQYLSILIPSATSQWIMSNFYLAWHLPNMTVLSVQYPYSPRPPYKPVMSALAPNMHQYALNQRSGYSYPTNQPMQQTSAVQNMEHNTSNLAAQEIQANPPHEEHISLVSVQNSQPNPTPPIQANFSSTPALSSQPQLKTPMLMEDLCECKVCNYKGNQIAFNKCIKCSALVCMIHYKVLCTNCLNSGPSDYSNRCVTLIEVNSSKCGLCIPENNIKYSMQCSKCPEFACFEHRHKVCLFCMNIETKRD